MNHYIDNKLFNFIFYKLIDYDNLPIDLVSIILEYYSKETEVFVIMYKNLVRDSITLHHEILQKSREIMSLNYRGKIHFRIKNLIHLLLKQNSSNYYLRMDESDFLEQIKNISYIPFKNISKKGQYNYTKSLITLFYHYLKDQN